MPSNRIEIRPIAGALGVTESPNRANAALDVQPDGNVVEVGVHRNELEAVSQIVKSLGDAAVPGYVLHRDQPLSVFANARM